MNDIKDKNNKNNIEYENDIEDKNNIEDENDIEDKEENEGANWIKKKELTQSDTGGRGCEFLKYLGSWNLVC